MNNISKQFAAWVTALKQSEFERAAVRLTGYYILGVLSILMVSSFAIYIFTYQDFHPSDNYLWPKNEQMQIEPPLPHSELSLIEVKEHFVNVLVVVDLLILIIATLISYLFARKTLRPIEAIYRQQERFVGDVAHELRTPLAVLKAGSDLILSRERSVDEYKEFIKESEEETDRLTRLTNDLLFLLKQQKARDEEFTKVDLSNLIEGQIKYFQPYASERNVTLEIICPPEVFVLGISDSLVRLCQNLLKNAIDYSHEGGLVQVKVVSDKKYTKVIFVDNGIGVPQDKQKMIFERFYKVDTSRTNVPQIGTGLGLSIVKDIVDRHLGSIEFKSVEGKGTTVEVRLPTLHS